MTELLDRPHAVTEVDHHPYQTEIKLAHGLKVVIESLDDIYLDGAAEPTTNATALDVLIGSTVSSIACSDDGTLTITITGDHYVTVPPDPDYEAWSVVRPAKGILAVALPGGGVALWS